MSSTRLLDIAIAEFGAKGLEGASTRGIAKAAGTAMSAITYHYGGKDGLYLAAADRIGALMAEGVVEKLGDEVAIGDDDPVAAREGVVRMLLRIAETMAGADTEAWSLFVVREQMHPTKAFERIYAGGLGITLRTLARLVGVATGAGARASRIAAMTLVGQPLALRGSRATFVRLLESDRLEPDDLDAFKARVAANTYAILDRLSAEVRDTP